MPAGCTFAPATVCMSACCVPRIDPQFLADAADMETLLKGVNARRRIMNAPPFCAGGPTELYTADACDDAALEAHIRQRADTTYHPVGTCRMGAADDPGAVV